MNLKTKKIDVELYIGDETDVVEEKIRRVGGETDKQIIILKPILILNGENQTLELICSFACKFNPV